MRNDCDGDNSGRHLRERLMSRGDWHRGAPVGAAAATGFLHTFSGWLMFVLASLLLSIQRGGAWFFRQRPKHWGDVADALPAGLLSRC